MRTAVNFVLGGVIFTSLLVGGMFLGAVATYGIMKDEIDAGRSAIANKRACDSWKKAWSSYELGFDVQHDVNKPEETKE